MMSAPAPYPTVQLSAPAPDDHQITSRTPSICVDYLSHNWTDEDVWSSWKAMTKVSMVGKVTPFITLADFRNSVRPLTASSEKK
jgi:hypothetical protein